MRAEAPWQPPLFAWCVYCGEVKPVTPVVRVRPRGLDMVCEDCQPVRERVLAEAMGGMA